MIQYAITDRRSYAAEPVQQLVLLVAFAERLAQSGVDYLQLREKDLSAGELRDLALRLRNALAATPLQLVFNGPLSIAHELGLLWHADGNAPPDQPAFSASCHSLDDVYRRRSTSQMLLFGPVFGKTVRGATVQPPAGLNSLRLAVAAAAGTPVLALGGVTNANAEFCLQAGASGIAGIRLFQQYLF